MTPFIIVGLIILLVTAGLLFLAKQVVKEPLRTAEEPVLEEVPQEFRPLQQYTVDCLRQVGERSIRLLGEQGGYIEPERIGEFSATNPTDADGVVVGSIPVPYWHYNGLPNGENKIAFADRKPELLAAQDRDFSIESQLGRYVNEKVASCLQEYRPFMEQGFRVTFDELDKEVTVIILDRAVDVFLEMPLEMSRGDAKATMQQFVVRLPVPLKKYYELGEQIVRAEQQFSFLERQALELVQIFSGVNQEKLPPTSAVSFDLGDRTVWTEMETKQRLQGLLNSYLPMLRFLESENFIHSEFPVADLSNLHQRLYDNMVLPYPLEQDVSVNVDYFDWPIYFNVNQDNGLIRSVPLETHFDVLNFFTDNYYTVYDISFPALITLRDEQAFNGKGYSFTFALEANVRNNEPVSVDTTLPPILMPREQSIICEPHNWDTELLRMLVVDSFTKEPLEAVQVGFSIPEVDFCTMGETNAAGRFESSFPAVYGGVGSFIKTDYLTSFYPIDTYRYREEPGVFGYAAAGLSEPVIELNKIRKIPVIIKKKLVEKCVGSSCFFSGLFPGGGQEVFSYTPEQLDEKHSWRFTGASRALDSTERATITLRKVADVNPRLRTDDFTTVVSAIGDEEQTIRLVPGVYEVQGVLVSERELVIPEEERCYDVLPFGIVEECYTLDRVSMGSTMSGQASWDTEATYVTITPEDLYAAGSLEFSLPSAQFLTVPPREHIRVIEDVQIMGEMERISKIPDVRAALAPQFR